MVVEISQPNKNNLVGIRPGKVLSINFDHLKKHNEIKIKSYTVFKN